MLPATRSFQSTLLEWFDRHRRDLPWRVAMNTRGLPDPYHVLLSEFMLQQTQVVTVVPYFHRFIAALPTLTDLATADEQVVLRLWQGLGYYSRARNLQRAARHVMERFAGRLPSDVESLLTLPGVGRYTAGAIASLAFDTPAPILDGNVIRVLSRLDHRTGDPRQPAAIAALWKRASHLVPHDRPGDFNSAMMELGATICTPRKPQCLICPVRVFCEAADRGDPEAIPPPRVTAKTKLHRRWTIVVRAGDLWLIEQRQPTGRWAGLWQFPTFAAKGRSPGGDWLAVYLPLGAGRVPKKIGSVKHALTHRRYAFTAFTINAVDVLAVDPPRRWVTSAVLDQFPMSKPMLTIRRMAE